MRSDHEGRKWPRWAEPLRPDELTRRRIRRDVLARAEALLRTRRESWQDVASGWAAMLIPIAAMLLLLFTAMAYQATAGWTEPGSAGAGTSVAVTPTERLVRPYEELMEVDDAPPGLLTAAEEPSRDAVLTAVIQTASRRAGGR